MVRLQIRNGSKLLTHSGSYGQVVVARDGRGDPVALKVARERPDETRAMARDRLIGEYRLQLHLCRNDAEHFARTWGFSEAFPVVYGVDWAKELVGLPYFVQEYLQGTTLADAVSAGTIFSVEEGRRLACHLVQAAAAMESAGFAHNDIAPSNVMLCYDGRVVLIDLGCATQFLASAPVVRHAGYESPMRVVGTPPSAADSLFSIAMCIRDACFLDYLPMEAFENRRATARQSLRYLPACDLAGWISKCLFGQFKTYGEAFARLTGEPMDDNEGRGDR